MIIYTNGQRETIKVLQQTKEDLAPTIKKEQLNDTTGTLKNLAKEKINYSPNRALVGFQQPLMLGIETEFRVVKNTLNIGLAYSYIFSKGENTLPANFAFVYASLYAPLNKIMGNYNNQHKGLFAFGHLGYSALQLNYIDFEGYKSSSTTGGFDWRVGFDYYINDGFGVNLSSYQLKRHQAGIVFQF